MLKYYWFGLSAFEILADDKYIKVGNNQCSYEEGIFTANAIKTIRKYGDEVGKETFDIEMEKFLKTIQWKN